jgi:PAS domain S-box-containing protein
VPSSDRPAATGVAAGPHLFGSFLESAPDAVVIIDGDGRIVLVNAQVEVLFGYARDELLGHAVEVLLPERYRGVHVHHRADYATEPHTRPMGAGLDLWGRRQDGTEFPVDISLSPLPSDDGVLLAAAIRDVTERQRLEQARDEFIRNAAHELRTPLATIAALGATLATHFDALEEEQLEDALAALRRQSQRASTLVANLLDLSQLDGGRTTIELESVPLAAAVQRSLDSAPPPQGADVFHDVAPDLRVIADISRLEQVITNLLTNAYRYGGPTIHIEAATAPAEGEASVLLVVSDDGPGVPESLRSDLFEPFTRGSGANDVGGSGIGLALSRRLVETFGGDLDHDAGAPGARFLCRLRAG